MKYVSLDLETTGLDPGPNNILMASFVVEDTTKTRYPVEQNEHFTCYVKPYEPITGGLYALKLNRWIFDILDGTESANYPILDPTEFESQAYEFLNQQFNHSRITIAGKNVAGFDLQFLSPLLKSMFRHRVIDIGSLYVDWEKDEYLPDLLTCKKRAGIDTPVAHDAREDAMDTIRLLRKKYT